ncbi:flavin-binding protein dodecin [Filimonas zeae]|uniref:Dodecin domain-containing protein n=1 Tax=Filimonas zeae TaxID=1737353 RepID=A0A917MVT2_9BACT|nr:dodecin family protein [Filimonas zeae]MDR6338642.1 flavin-binding protein dodecin [Filimonas zeae]GGH67257.1 hypothetical protein GCM10011379_22340 [Filimonas zeae]
MSIVKVIEVIASSEKSIEDALQQAVAEASKTIRNIDSVYVKDIKAHVKDGKITSYGLISKISFRLDENGQDSEPSQAATESEATPQASKATNAASVTPKVPQQAEATTEASAQPTPEASQQEGSEQTSSEERYKQGVTADQEQEAQPQAQSEQETQPEQEREEVESEEEKEEKPAHQKDFVPAH